MNELATLTSTVQYRLILPGCDMGADEFNKKYAVGHSFMYCPNPILRGGKIVKTADVARDFNCGSIVEINLEPYFVKIDTLKSAQ